MHFLHIFVLSTCFLIFVSGGACNFWLVVQSCKSLRPPIIFYLKCIINQFFSFVSVDGSAPHIKLRIYRNVTHEQSFSARGQRLLRCLSLFY